MTFDVDKIRNDFPVLFQSSRGKPLIYLDNAATTQRPKSVIKAVSSFYENDNANIHRSVYELGERATIKYEDARVKVQKFINAEKSASIIFTKGTTESINLVAYAYGRTFLKPGDEILISEMEHHSNIVPWQQVAETTGCQLKYIPITDDGTLVEDWRNYFSEKTKFVAITHQSNVLGSINPVKDIITYAHDKGAKILIDAAQSVPHMSVDVQNLGCDFLVFSGHKMLAPTGVGVLYGKTDILNAMPPFLFGGDMISQVGLQSSKWNDLPHKFEAGTPNIAQVIGLGAAIDYINELGIDSIHQYEHELTQYALSKFEELDTIKVFGTRENRGAILSFHSEFVHPHDMAQFLDADGIAVRAGHHCAQPLMERLRVPATTRASLYFYNTREEIDILVNSIKNILKIFSVESQPK